MERAALFADAPVVTEAMLEPLSAEGPHPAVPAPGASAGAVTPEEAMRQHLLGVLEQSAGNISHAAARLGIARNTLYARLEKYGVRGHHPPLPPPRSARDRPGPGSSEYADSVGAPRDHAALRRPRRSRKGSTPGRPRAGPWKA